MAVLGDNQQEGLTWPAYTTLPLSVNGCLVDRTGKLPSRLDHFICNTPKIASFMILEDILETPSSRSLKVIGTSFTLKPSNQAANFISI